MDASPLVLLDEVSIGELRLGVLVQRFHVGMGGGGVEVIVAVLGVLSMVTLATRQAKDALLQDGVLLVPQGQAEAEAALPVANPQQAIFPPTVDAGTGMVVGKVLPAAQRQRNQSVHYFDCVLKQNSK